MKRRARENNPGPAAEPRRVRVVIVGGGCAGLSCAWQLTTLNQQREHARGSGRLTADALAQWPIYEVTVYEASWRLGGKGASVRDAEGRILEHGLHVWLGFYENAFRMMRECYAELATANPPPALTHRSVEEAFVPEPQIGVAGRRAGAWEAWSAQFPPMKGQPGEPLEVDNNPFTAWAYLARAFGLMKALMQSVFAPASQAADADGQGPFARSPLDEAVELDFSYDPLESPSVLVERLAHMARVSLLTTAAGVLQAASFVESWLRERNPAPQIASSLLKFIEAIATNTRRQLQDLVLVDESLRRKTEVLDLLLTIILGLYRDKVFLNPNGLDAIDNIDYCRWLEKHGASTGAQDSPLVTGIYDLVFAYRDGDHRQRALSAAQALRGAMRMFLGYRGSMFWRMRSGMGDAVFAPLYCALRARGVRFGFLHRLGEVEFDFDAAWPKLTALRFETAGPPRELLEAGHHALDAQGCWPADRSVRFGNAISDAAADSLLLRAEADFDAVVIATGLDDLVALCDRKPDQANLFKRLPAWDRMRKLVKTVATRSAQVWLDRNLEELGWERGPVILAGLGAAARDEAAPAPRLFETWADMTHVLAAERAYRAARAGRPVADAVRSVAYFCGVMPDRPAAQSADDAASAARSDLANFLAEQMRDWWPRAYLRGRSPLNHLVRADGARKAARAAVDAQYVVVNDQGSARYTQSLPGSGTCRISPLDPWFANMTVAGDWTDCGFNGGCVEAAVMSGMLAAHALSGRLDLNSIVGYHHP